MRPSAPDHSTSNPTSIAQKAALGARGGFVQMMGQAFRTRRDYMVKRLN